MLKDILAAILRWVRGTQSPEAVAKALDDLAAKRGEKLDWRNSIVDLLKLIDMDSSLTARQRLAKEMGHIGDFTGSASDNVWLHGEVMKAIGQKGVHGVG